jgi:DNA transformation protein
MPVSPGVKRKLLDGLGRIAPVTDRAMFGAVGLYSEGLFFGLIDDDVLFFKVDDTNRAEYEKEGMPPFCPPGERGSSMNYYRVPDTVLGNVRKLKGWMDRSIGVARRAGERKAAAKKKPRPGKKPTPRN